MSQNPVNLLLTISDNQADEQRTKDIALSLMRDLRNFNAKVYEMSEEQAPEKYAKGVGLVHRQMPGWPPGTSPASHSETGRC